MPITGLTFLLFALGAVVLYYLFPKRLRQYVLLAASILFYLTYGVRMAGYLAATVLLTYLFGLWLDRLAAFRPAAETKEERKRLKRENDRKKRRVLALALVLNFASLVLLKYGGFLVSSVNALLSVELTLPRFLLPLGISFYIFQTSAYLIDISRGKHRAERGFLRYALFVCYFPQMVQGPINRFAALQPQLTEGNDFSWDNIQHGFLRLLYGVLKKAMIADTLAPIVAKIYGGYASYPGIVCFLGAALYCVQLYCDFSGGIDLMMGISRLFGISMQENFCRPYFSVSLSDFWRRWHISLGEWMKDYLFYPLALSKPFGKLAQLCRRHMPLDVAKCIVPSLSTFLVFLAVGVWQGPGFANIAYGLWNGFWMSLAMFRAPIVKHLPSKRSADGRKKPSVLWGILRTNLLVIIGRYFSNAASLRSALGMLKQTVLHFGVTRVNAAVVTELGFSLPLLLKVVPMLGVVFAVSLASERGTDVARWLCERKRLVQFLILFAALLAVVLFVYGNAGYTPIAYVYENV